MYETIFVDTGYVIALINQRDECHSLAVGLARQFKTSPLLTTDAVLLEIGNGLSKQYKKEACAVIEKFLSSPQIQIVHLSSSLFQEGFKQYKSYQDKSWGLVDCCSFVVMKQYEIKKVLSFDKHFSQAGFTVLS
jgi:predicted nucleic acid-binding protein